MTLLQQLWELAERETQKRGKHSYGHFYGLALYNVKNLKNEGYDSTPINSTTFGGTGGDGVHFGLLHIDGAITDSSPVIMTVPMNFDRLNLVVGEDLIEFLRLGCDVGYFDLEQLSYNFGRLPLINRITNRQSELDDEQQESLKILRDEFNLKPWTNVEARLDELDKQYLPLLQLKEDS